MKCVNLLLLVVTLGCTVQERNYRTKVMVVADSAMVVSAHPLASAIGLDVLRSGGNAIDASVAVQLALAVVYPSAGNIGGGGFLVIRFANGDAKTLDYREKAPGNATTNMFLNENEVVINGLSE